MEAQSNNSINHRLDKIEQTLERLESAFLGDKYTNGRGYISENEELKKRVSQLEKNQSSLKWFMFGSGVTGGAGLIKVLESFF
jgi:hypothetical protein